MTFNDRLDAGELLSHALKDHLPADRKDVVVVGLPRGGVIVAASLARRLGLPVGFIIIKKIGHPDNPEFAVGAVGPKEIFLNPDVSVDPNYVKQTAQELRKEIARQSKLYHHGTKDTDRKGKIIVLVDDGIATGLTVKTAIAELRSEHPQKIILAVPVAAADSLGELAHDADDVVCLYTPALFMAVGQFYQSFDQVSENEVRATLRQ